MAEQGNELQLLERLESELARLEGGSLEIGGFNTWFMNSEWEARMANNASALRLGWGIQNILYEWQDFPELISASLVAASIRELLLQEERTHSVTPAQQRSIDPNLVRLIKSATHGPALRSHALSTISVDPARTYQYQAGVLSTAMTW